MIRRALLALAALTVCLRLAAAGPKLEVVIDFTDSHRDPGVGGKVFHAYEYAFGDWDKHVVDLPRRGVLVKAATGKGGLGENDPIGFKNLARLNFHYLIGNANSSKGVVFSLEDLDGTEFVWNVPLDGQPTGHDLQRQFDLTKPDTIGKLGKTAGLNLKKIASWQVRGNYSEANVEVLLVKLTGEK